MSRRKTLSARPVADLPAPAVPAEVLPAPVGDEVIDLVVAEINALQRDATVELAIRVGEVIVRHFYGGDLAAFREHGAKETSLRKLAARAEKDLSMSASGMYRSVAIYDLDQRLGVSGRKHLGVTHLRAVLGLPEAQQTKLLAMAEAKGWTGERLEQEAARLRARDGDRRGRPPLPAFAKGLTLLKRAVEVATEGDVSAEDVVKYGPDKARQDVAEIDELMVRLSEMKARVLAALADQGPTSA